MIKLALPLLIVASPALAVDYAPNEITIQMAPGTKPPIVIRRYGNTVSQPSITVNKADKVTVLQPVVMHGGMHVDTSALPAFSAGTNEFRVRPTTEQPSPSDAGAFRTVCDVKGMSFDDSIVYPNEPGRAHFHVFAGNTLSDAFSTAESIKTTGNSTCRGGVANRSSYWFPALLDMRTNRPLVPTSIVIYYKNGVFTTTGSGFSPPVSRLGGFNDLPIGLRMIAGNPTRTTPRTNDDPFDFRWTCQGPKQTFTSELPVTCPVGSVVEQEVFFPQCWDGKNLDSPDHKSHMAFPVNVKNVGDPRGWFHLECPSTHPKIIPAISINVNYAVTAADAVKNWRLVSDVYSGAAGYSSHADWRNGWDPAISSAWTQNCIRAMKDCHAHLVGDGREMY